MTYFENVLNLGSHVCYYDSDIPLLELYNLGEIGADELLASFDDSLDVDDFTAKYGEPNQWPLSYQCIKEN